MCVIHSTKLSGNFGLKLNGSLRFNRKSFEKIGPPFEVGQFSRLDWSDRNSILPFRPTLNPRTLLFGKDALIPFFFSNRCNTKYVLTFFLRYRYRYRYCDVIELTGKSRDLVDQAQNCLTLLMVVIVQYFLVESTTQINKSNAPFTPKLKHV